MVSYRQVYIKHYGLIPKEPNGRSYDIHHMDSDHSNDDPGNLKAVSLQEHYDIHYAKGELWACVAISMRMDRPLGFISGLSKKAFATGSHPFQNKAWASERERRRVERGDHPFLGGEIQRRTMRKRVADGTHNMLGGEMSRMSNKKMMANGTHPFLTMSLEKRKAAGRKGGNNPNGGFHTGKAGAAGGRIGGRKTADLKKSGMQKTTTCQHCGTVGQMRAMGRWHFDNCKSIGGRDQQPPQICAYCGDKFISQQTSHYCSGSCRTMVWRKRKEGRLNTIPEGVYAHE